jgi:hypothetical protein
MKLLKAFPAILLACCAAAQTTTPAASATTPTVTFPAIPLPTSVAAFGEFNQLGSPRFTMGISAIYPVSGSVGLYGTTTADILPKLAVDPTTGRKFYAISSSVRQGFHKDLFDTGNLSFLIGADVGPTFGQAQPSGINVNFSSSFVATAIYQITPAFSFLLPVRMLYITGVGWNPVVEAGVVINLKNLPKAKK